MMDHIVGHVVRRGMEAHREWRHKESSTGEKRIIIEAPFWGVVMWGATVCVFLSALILTEYTFGRLIPTLQMIESPTAVLFEPSPVNDPNAPVGDSTKEIDDQKAVASETQYLKVPPITATFRTTITHLRSELGIWSRFRGITFYAFYVFLLHHLAYFLHLLVQVPRGLDMILASTALSTLLMGWTHMVMSKPRNGFFLNHLPALSLWKKVALPTAIYASTVQTTIMLVSAMACRLELKKHLESRDYRKMDKSEFHNYVLSFIAVGFTAIFCGVCIIIPAKVALTRVQASLISSEETTIVPFDATFGGRVVSVADGGSGVIGMIDAWRTFDRSSRFRILKTYFKLAHTQVALVVFGAVALFFEHGYILGKVLDKKV